MSYKMHYLFVILFINLVNINLSQCLSKTDICGQTNGIDLSALDLNDWNLTHIKGKNERIDYNIHICTPFNASLDSIAIECNNSHICRHNLTDNRSIGFQLKSVSIDPEIGSKVRSVDVHFEGPACDEDNTLNQTISIRFTCGPHLEYPKHFLDMKCKSYLNWRTSSVCDKKSVQNEVKCYVFDSDGNRRDLTPLIKAKGEAYQVLSARHEFYINVCSGLSSPCTEPNTGACLKDGNKFTKVGDYRFNTLQFRGKSVNNSNEYIEMTYRTKSKVCNTNTGDGNAKTTIRFICPTKEQKKTFEFLDRSPKLVSELDCEYQIEWLTEYACPLSHIEASAKTCELTEEFHGFDFNLKTLFKISSNALYKISNISIDSKTKTVYDIEFNVCGGLGEKGCGDKKWKTIAVCLKSNNESITDQVIGLTTESKLSLADNRFVLEYKNKDSECKFGDNPIAETTVIEFVCDDSVGMGLDSQSKGSPEFVSFEDCVYYIIWRTRLVCPIVSPNIPCLTTYNNWTFDLSPLNKGFESEPWIAGVSQALPWSRHSKDKNDMIYVNVCGFLPKTVQTSACEGRSSACMTIADTNTTINLGQFMSSPKYNEDMRAIELVYVNGFNERTKQKITSKFTLHCKRGLLNSDPILVDIDEEKGMYEFEWETSAACPIDSFYGNECKVYDKYLDFEFDLSPLKNKTSYLIQTNDYDFYINVCDEVNVDACNASAIKNAESPIGGCQVERKGGKRAFSLGKSSTSLIYWNGFINLTLTNGSPYNNEAKTPRKSEIAFICNPNIGNGFPEFDGEKDRSYFFRWYTSLACPHVPKVVHCVWDNGSHILDLTQLAMTNGNHVTVGLSSGTSVPSIYYINICRPLNSVHSSPDIKECGLNSAACRVQIGGEHPVLSLGEATDPPMSAFDGSINLFYANGSPCPTKPNKTISTRIKFVCDPIADLSNPIVYEPGSDGTGNDECVYIFEWRTSAVCDVIQPTKPENNSCVFTDNRTGLKVDLSPLKRNPNQQPYKIPLNSNSSAFELNVCGVANSHASPQCKNSGVCLMTDSTGTQISDDSVINYGLLTSSSFFFDGIDLKLMYFNGSKCHSNTNSGRMSSEIIFKCNPNAQNTRPKLYSSHACIAVFEWETDLVCSLRLPKCSVVADNKLYNIRQLSTISHAWNASDGDKNVYFLNICTKLPQSIGCVDPNAAVCRCVYDNNQLISSDSLGDPSTDELQVLPNGDLLLTYSNGRDRRCAEQSKAQTQITFKCGQRTGNPEFKEFILQDCIYKFEWTSFIACPVGNQNDVLVLDNGYLKDSRIGAYMNIRPLLTTTFDVMERRLVNNKTDDYVYVINLSKPTLDLNTDCSKAAVCQTKEDSEFKRDIGTIGSIEYYLKGHELQIVLNSWSDKKCGKNRNKNVTTIFRLQCSSTLEVGKPVFMYESNDCDYTFNWETGLVCLEKWIDKDQFASIPKSLPNEGIPSTSDDNKSKSNRSSVWIGILIVVFFVVTICVLVFYKQRVRQSVMFRFRRLFGPDTSNHTFHYHQLASQEKDRQPGVVLINRNTIAAQPSAHVPYNSIYDESDVDLLI